MKKSIILCTMVAVCFFIWTACQKEQSTTKVADVAQDDVTPKIKAFSERLKFASTPNTEVNARDAAYSSVDAAWNLEALINQVYGHPSESFEGEFKSENKEVVVSKVNGQISDVALLAAYTAMWTNQRDFYNSISDVNKYIVAVDVELAEDNALNARLSVTTYIGKKLNLSYVPTAGDWRFNNQGKCDGTILTGGAANEINKAVNSGLGSNTFFTITDIKVITLPGSGGGIPTPTPTKPNLEYSLMNTSDQTPNDNKRDRLLLYIRSNYPNFVHAQCVSEIDITWYVNNINTIILPIAKPVGLVPININLSGAFLLTGDPYPALHRGPFTFGKKVKKSIDMWKNPNDFEIFICC